MRPAHLCGLWPTYALQPAANMPAVACGVYALCPAVARGLHVVWVGMAGRYWLIGGKYYDLEPFLHRHPGGKQALVISHHYERQ